ncbi:MAG: DUF3857 domain-containing protein [Nibricoccus sp.]
MPFSKTIRCILNLRLWILGALLAIGGGSLHARPSAPEWINAAIAKPATFDYGKANTAILVDESKIEVSRSGVFTRRTRWLVKILKRDGRSDATALVHYNTSSDRVISFQAWLVRAAGEVVPYEKRKAVDVARFGTLELYSEDRNLCIDASDEADAGAVFGYETVIETKHFSNQEIWYFQGDKPSEHSSVSVTLPPGWDISALTFNHETIQPSKTDRTTTWTLERIPAYVQEALAPPSIAYCAWLALDIRPPAGTKTTLINFTNWADVSRFATTRHDAAASSSDAAIKAKAASLIAGLATPWERINALSRFAQQVNYISIVLNSANAGGMTPRNAAKVLQSNYGDCKDKATLLRALLASAGIESYPLVVYSGDAGHIRVEWPSPCQFNHCIIGIKVDDSVKSPALLQDPEFGRLLIFDPTNTNTPPGWLPEEDCGGHALVLAGDHGRLIQMPIMPKEHNSTSRKITAKLLGDGSLTGSIEETKMGIASTDERRVYKESSATDYRKVTERWMTRSLPGATIVQLEASDDFNAARFTTKIDFKAPTHGKSMRDVLLVFKPVLVSRFNGTSLKKEKRNLPILFADTAFKETTTIELPEDFEVEELPPPVRQESAFGTYIAQIRQDGRNLRLDRTIEYRRCVIPASEYESVRAYMEKMTKAEQAPVVLRRKAISAAKP